MSGPLITDLPLWEELERSALAILRSSLLLLRTDSPSDGESKLNRELYFCINEVNNENRKSGGPWIASPVILEARNPPTPDTEDSASERKIPDLSWQYYDHLAQDPRRAVRSFAIECKRLGSPSSSGWKFNVHYVEDGVRRFTHLDWRYGKDVATGSMVGYVESLTPEHVGSEVNEALKQHGMSTLTLPPADGPLMEMEHSLVRPFAITPFRLVHLWIDIRPTRLTEVRRASDAKCRCGARDDFTGRGSDGTE